MGIVSTTETRRGGLNKVNITAFVRYFFIALVLSVLFLGLGTLLSRYVEDNSGSVEIMNWNYVWIDKEKDLDEAVTKWETATDTSSFENPKGYDYLHLQTTFSANTQNYILSILSGNNLTNLEIDGKKVLEQLDNSYMYSGTPLIETTLTPSEDDQLIDLYMYVPATLDFSATIEKVDGSKATIRIAEILELVFGAVFAGFGLILLTISIVTAVKTKKYNTMLILGFLSAAFGFAVIFNQSGVVLQTFSQPIFFRFTITFLFFVSFCVQLIVSNILEIKKEFQWLVYVGAILSISFLAAPYDVIGLFFLRLFGVWSAVCFIGFIIIILQKGIPVSFGKLITLTSYLVALIAQIIYWSSFLVASDLAGKEMLILSIGGFIIAVTCYFESNTFVVNKNYDTKKSIEFNANFLEKFSKILLEKADTNSGHLENVSRYAEAMCTKLKMSPETISMVASATLLHDIGKIAIPRAIIEKEETITQEEFDQIRCHVLHGYNILTDPNDKFLQLASNIARHHHEKYDGSGYLGLKGDEIDLFSQITALADTFDALTQYRAYKKTWSFNEACEYINTHAGDFFDPEIVKLFNSCRKEFWDIFQHRHTNQ